MIHKVFVGPGVASIIISLALTAGSYAASPVNEAASKPVPAASQGWKDFASTHIRFSYPAELGARVESRTNPSVKLESPDDKPDGVAPEHVEITITGTGIGGKIYVFPTKVDKLSTQAFKKSFPTVVDAKDALAKMLTSKAPASGIPVLPWADASSPFEVHQKRIRFTNGEAIRYVAEYLIEPDVIDNARLVYCGQGLSADGKWYVSVTIPLSTRSLPKKTNVAQMAQPAYQKFSKDFRDYAKKVGAKLERLPDSAYQPDLERLDKFVQSIVVQ